MEPWTGAQNDFAVKAFYKNGDSLWSLGVNFEESSGFIAIVLFHQPMPSRPGLSKFQTSPAIISVTVQLWI